MNFNFSNKFIDIFIGYLQNIFNTTINKDNWVDCYNGMSGTNGWHKALISTCDKINENFLVPYYDHLNWEYSDLFDCILGEFIEKYLAK